MQPCQQVETISNIKTDTALLSQSVTTMNKKLDSIEKKLDKFIE